MIENFYDKESVLFYLSFKGLAKKKLDEFSAMLQTSTGYSVYNMPESAIQDVLEENGLSDSIQATNRAMMTFLLYKWFPIPEAWTYALMLWARWLLVMAPGAGSPDPTPRAYGPRWTDLLLLCVSHCRDRRFNVGEV